ncbi:MAG: hypothetical protein IID18_06555 [Nitrospinae bacterium]|nr:hypothetical protein [Nitrospinota bacterium]
MEICDLSWFPGRIVFPIIPALTVTILKNSIYLLIAWFRCFILFREAVVTPRAWHPTRFFIFRNEYNYSTSPNFPQSRIKEPDKKLSGSIKIDLTKASENHESGAMFLALRIGMR